MTTGLCTLLSFAMALLIGIVGVALTNLMRGGPVDMTLAYRGVGLPVAAAALVISLVISLVSEIGHHRRSLREWHQQRPAA